MTRNLTPRGLGVILLAGLVLALGSAGGSILASRRYAENAIHESEQKLCGVVILSDDTYRETPPATKTGKEIAANFAYLRQAYGCPPYQGK